VNRIVVVLLVSLGPACAQTSFWTSSTVPATASSTDTQPVTLGLKFTSDVAGSITAVRFYKGTGNTGTHTGNLWSASGAKLATVVFSGETASGWQQANFSPAVSIAANTVYTVSYRAPVGRYALSTAYAWSGINRLPLRVSGSAPGVYAYGSTIAFPTQTWNNSNYWVDVVFIAMPPPTTTYSISGTITGVSENVNLSGAAIRNTITSSTRSFSFTALPNGSYIVTPTQSGYVFTPSSRSVVINGANVTGVTFTVGFSSNPPPTSARVDLTWTASESAGVIGYNVYRRTATSTFAKVNTNPIITTQYIDSSVAPATTYVYAATAVDSFSESSHSNEVTAMIP
jgi:hypothetical protein